MGNKRLAVVAGGWHYPLQFYQEMAKQKIPPGWDVDFFCVGHRPAPGKPDEKDALGIWDKDKIGLFLYDLDRILYGQFADLNALESLGWFYSLEPNTMGDYGFTNQGLAKHDYREYDIVCSCHDDTLMLSDKFLGDVLTDDFEIGQKDPSDGTQTIPSESRDGSILTHATAPYYYHIRCTMDFFKRETLDLLGGRFDDSDIALNRTGKDDTPTEHNALGDWNRGSNTMIAFIEKNNLQDQVKFLSPFYRISKYCVEGERGTMHKMNGGADYFKEGLNTMIQQGVL